MKTEQELRESYYKLANDKHWGSCFECCDFEKMTEQTADFWLNKRKEEQEDLKTKMESFITNNSDYNKGVQDCINLLLQ